MKAQKSKLKDQTKFQIQRTKSQFCNLGFRTCLPAGKVLDFVWILIFGFWISTLVAGCSRTVTQMPTFGNELLIEVTLSGKADLINNRYFVVFSTLEAYQIPLPPPDSLDEFLEPGDEPQPGTTTKEAYYSKYYSTWSGYVVVDSSGYSLAKGPFVYGTTQTRESVATISDATNKLSCDVRLERIFGSTLPRNVYIDIITASYPQADVKVLKDRISPPVNSFEPIKGTIIERTDPADSTVDPSLDILSWKVTLP